jgi:hypothetical protein
MSEEMDSLAKELPLTPPGAFLAPVEVVTPVEVQEEPATLPEELAVPVEEVPEVPVRKRKGAKPVYPQNPVCYCVRYERGFSHAQGNK